MKSVLNHTIEKYNNGMNRINEYRIKQRGSNNKVTKISSTTTITCKDGSIGYVNDNYCDCIDDGEDEPLT
jgi:hypothetical protein